LVYHPLPAVEEALVLAPEFGADVLDRPRLFLLEGGRSPLLRLA
jgi:hypothetical protein